MATPTSSNARLNFPCDIQCLQVNLRRSKQSLLCLLVDIANKKIHPKDVNILFLTEPPRVTTNNKLSDVPE